MRGTDEISNAMATATFKRGVFQTEFCRTAFDPPLLVVDLEYLFYAIFLSDLLIVDLGHFFYALASPEPTDRLLG